jgi:proline dehydrogenase
MKQPADAGRPEMDQYAAGTTPPHPESLPALRALKAAVSARISALILPLAIRAARNYTGGETADDALCVARRLAAEAIPSTVGLWDTPDYTQRQAAEICLTTINQLAASGLDSYLSIKPPALGYDLQIARDLAIMAKAANIRLHCDSHGPETAEASHAMVQAMLGDLEHFPAKWSPLCVAKMRPNKDLEPRSDAIRTEKALDAAQLGVTLPGRWLRSLDDADWAVERGLNVRVVKGQWPCSSDPRRDLRTGFLEVIDRLAGRAFNVAVATHDIPLAEEAIARLRAAGGACEIEQLYGIASARSLRWAKENGIKVRLYIPFGKGYIPNAIGLLKRNPRLVWVILRKFAALR